MTKTRKKNRPTHYVVVDNGGRFTGTDGKEHISYEQVGVAWSDESGISSVRLPLLGVTLYFRERKEEGAGDATADE